MQIYDRINQIERVHNLIKRKATGSPKSLSIRLGTSERHIYNIINVMKLMGAPIFFSNEVQSYCYKENVEFKIGFFVQDDSGENVSQLRGGVGDLYFSLTDNNLTMVDFLEYRMINFY